MEQLEFKLKPLKWRTVNSSCIHAVAYDRQRKVLYVEFNHGGRYTYQHIGYHRFSRLLKAESIGKYFNEAIRPKDKAA
jgi:hypothetical protein